MTIQRIGAEGIIADAVIHQKIAYLSGQVADDPVPSSVYDQTRKVLEQIDGILKKCAVDKRQILKAQIWLSDISTFDEMNRAWKEWLPAGCAPARATVEAKLARHPKWAVEIMVTAAISEFSV
ncbi:MAG: RidA family protein [Verrucomicrobiota bacterium]